MNRRGFLQRLGVVAAGFAILPSAQLYTRTWKVERFICEVVDLPPMFDEVLITSPEWLTAPYEVAWIMHPEAQHMLNIIPAPRRFRLAKELKYEHPITT